MEGSPAKPASEHHFQKIRIQSHRKTSTYLLVLLVGDFQSEIKCELTQQPEHSASTKPVNLCQL